MLSGQQDERAEGPLATELDALPVMPWQWFPLSSEFDVDIRRGLHRRRGSISRRARQLSGVWGHITLSPVGYSATRTPGWRQSVATESNPLLPQGQRMRRRSRYRGHAKPGKAYTYIGDYWGCIFFNVEERETSLRARAISAREHV